MRAAARGRARRWGLISVGAVLALALPTAAQGATPPLAGAFFVQEQAVPGTDVGLLLTLNNVSDVDTLTGVAVSATLPAGLAVATPGGLSSDCGGTATAPDGGTVVSLSGGTLAPESGCAISVATRATGGPGTYTVATTAPTAVESGPGTPSGTASLVVLASPTVTEAFGASTIRVGETTTVTYGLVNPNPSATLFGFEITDDLPSGLRIADPRAASGTCLDDAGAGGTALGDPGAARVELVGVTLTGGSSCSLTLSLVGTGASTAANPTGPVIFSYDAGGGDFRGGSVPGATASLVVVAPPVVTLQLGAGQIAPGQTTTLSFSVQNPNATTSLSGVGFAAALPEGVSVATPNGLTGACGGGTFGAPAGGSAVSLAGATLAAGASCTVTVSVTAGTAGTRTVSSGPVSSVQGGSGAPGTASLTVVTPPPGTPPGTGAPPAGPAGPSPPTQTPPAGLLPPNTVFTVGGVRGAKSGTVTFTVGVPGPGAVEALATMRRSAGRRPRALAPETGRLVYARGNVVATAAGKLRVKLTPTALGRRALRNQGTKKLRLNVRVRFTPRRYSPATGGRLLVVKRTVLVGG